MLTIQTNVKCNYCGTKANLSSGSLIYGEKYAHLLFYVCGNWPKCNAYVGVHKGTTTPLGNLANPELRRWRSRVHQAFDCHWRFADNKREARTQCYEWLRQALKIPATECHIGMFDVERCKTVLFLLHNSQNQDLPSFKK